MKATQVCLAVDLGAGSGRVMAAVFNGDRVELDELNRFANDGVSQVDGWHWDFDRLFINIKKGIALAVAKYGDAVKSVGVDTWGVDYGLLNAEGKLLNAPFQYRDRRTQGMQEEAFRKMSRRDIYERTGIQFMFFNTLFQLVAETKAPAQLEKAGRLLFMPDLIHYFLTGVGANEKSIASTSQLLNPHTQAWETTSSPAWDFPAGFLAS